MRGGDSITKKQNKDLNKNQLLGRERTLNRSIESQKKKLEKLTETYQSKLVEIQTKINETKSELKEVQGLISEETWIQNLDRVYLVKNDKTIRGKVYYRNKWRWIHVGQTQSLKDKSDIDLKKIVKDKFFKTLVSNK